MTMVPTSRFKKIHWHDDALAYAEMYGLTKEDCEAILINKSRPKLDARTHEVGHLIVRYRAGDVVVVVGHRELDEPVIMSVWVDDHNRDKASRRAGGGPADDAAPKSMKDLTRRIKALGYHLDHRGKHIKVLDPDTGNLVATLPSTPSDWRSIPNSWALFRRKHAKNKIMKEKKSG